MDFLVLTLGFGGVEGGIECVASGENLYALGENSDGAHLLGHKGALLVTEDGKVLNEVVGEAFGHTGSGTSRVLELSDRERHRGESRLHLREESSGALHLKHVLLVELTLVDGSTAFIFLGDTLAGGDVHVKADNITGSEAPLINLLSGSLLGDDGVVRVDAVLEDLMGEDGFNLVDLELFANARNSLGHVAVGVANTDGTLSRKHGGVAGDSDVVGRSGDLIRLRGADGACEGGVGSPAINVASSNNFADISGS